MTPDPRIPPEGGKSVETLPVEDQGFSHNEYGVWLVTNVGVLAAAAYITYKFSKVVFGPYGFVGHLGKMAFWASLAASGYFGIYGDSGGDEDRPGGGYGGSGRGSSGSGGAYGGSSGSGSSGSGSQGSGGRPSGQHDEPHALGGGVDYGSSGGSKGDSGGSTTKGDSGKSASTKEEKKEFNTDVEVDENGNWYDKRTGEKGGPKDKMPNPEDPSGGTGEGPDKDWWRDLPYASAWSVAESLKSPWKYDERHGTAYLSLGAPAGTGHMIGFLTPQLIEVDEGGEGVTLNLTGAVSTSTSAGTTTSDGWGDKPRTLLEALAAPRIRDALTSRF